MRNKARKHIWPVSLAMSLALVGVLAVVALALAGSNTAQAHGPCDLSTWGGSGDTLSFPFVECVATEGDEVQTHDDKRRQRQQRHDRRCDARQYAGLPAHGAGQWRPLGLGRSITEALQRHDHGVHD